MPSPLQVVPPVIIPLNGPGSLVEYLIALRPTLAMGSTASTLTGMERFALLASTSDVV